MAPKRSRQDISTDLPESKRRATVSIDQLLSNDKFLQDCALSPIDIDEKTPFDSDASYVQFLLNQYTTIALYEKYRRNSVTRLTCPQAVSEGGWSLEESRKVLLSLKAKYDQLEDIRLSKLNSSDTKPRLVRLIERLKLKDNEAKLFSFMVAEATSDQHLGTELADLRFIGDCLGMRWDQVSHFIDDRRTHNKQGFYDLDDAREVVASFNKEALYALNGVELSDKQMLEIDNTELSTIVDEERPAELRRSGSFGASPASRPSRSKLRKLKARLARSKVRSTTSEFQEADDDDAADESARDPEDDGDEQPGADDTEDKEDDANDDEQDQADTEPEDETTGDMDADDQTGDDHKSSGKDGQQDDDDEEKEEDLYEFLKKEINAELERGHARKTTSTASEEEDRDAQLVPYTTDLDYLESQCKHIFLQLRIAELRKESQQSRAYGDYSGSDSNKEIRKLTARERVQKKRCERRLELTRQSGDNWLPRLERLALARSFDDFEKKVLLCLIGSHISAEFHALSINANVEVGTILNAFCSSLQEQIQCRRYFYKNATLIKEKIVRLMSDGAELTSQSITIDRRMLDYALGLDTEFSEVVEGSHLYLPRVKLDDVVLPEEQRRLIVDTVRSFDGFKRARKRMGFDEKLGYGSGICKTLMANAIGRELNKRILLINFPSLGDSDSDQKLQLIFREAKVMNAIVFFDEAESLFESRDKGNRQVNLLLTEMERHDEIIIMATNRAFDLDEAMHRRITLAIEFHKPDPLMRERIWRTNMPSAMRLADDVDLKALSLAVSRDGEEAACIRQADLVHGARLQLRGRLQMIDFDRRVVPRRGIDQLVLRKEQKSMLEDIVLFEKARQVLFGQWGFDRTTHEKGTTVMFHGSPGTGKTLAAEAVAFSLGRPIKLVNVAELQSKWVGESSKNINAIFEEARNVDCVLVFDECEGLFGKRSESSSSTDRYANADVGLLLYHMENYPGTVILCTNLVSEIDQAFFRRIKFVVEFPDPNAEERAQLWQSVVPKETPQAKDIDFRRLANTFEFAGGAIKSAVIRAAARAALREETTRMLTMEDLIRAAKEEQSKAEKRPSGAHLYT